MSRQTRSRSTSELATVGPPELILGDNSGTPYAASNIVSQKEFLKMMGPLDCTHVDYTQEILDDETAEILSAALNHKDMYTGSTEDVEDPHFTPEEWEKYQSSLVDILDTHVKNIQEGSLEDEKDQLLVEKRMKIAPRCHCSAHRNGMESNLIGLDSLMTISETLNDDTGKKVANILLPIIFEKAGMRYRVDDCNQGSIYTLNYTLKLPSGQQFRFTGWPDFTVSSNPPPQAREVHSH